MAHKTDETEHASLTSSLPGVSRTHLSLGGVLLVAFAVRIYRLNSKSLWLDEVTTLTTRATLPVEQILDVAVSSSPHPPGYFISLHYWLTLVGATPLTARLFSVVVGVGAVLFTYGVGRELFTARTGVVGALLLALSPMHIQYSQEARMYALLSFLTVASTYFFVRLLNREFSARVPVGYVICTVCLLYTHLFAIFVVLAHNLYVLFVYGWPGDEFTVPPTKWVSLQLLVGAAFVPWLVLIRENLVGLFTGGGESLIGWIAEPTTETLLQTLLSYSGYVTNYPYWSDGVYSYLFAFVLLFAIAALTWTAFLGYRPETTTSSLREYLRRYLLLLTWLSALVFVPYVVSLLFTPIYYVRYTIGALPAFYLLAGRGVDALQSTTVRRIAVLVLVVGLVTTAGVYHSTPSSEQWKEAGAYIDAEAEQGELVFLTPTYLDQPVAYYTSQSSTSYRGVASNVSGFDDGPNPANETSQQRFWVVTATTYDQATGWLGVVDTSYSLLEHRQFRSVHVYLYATDSSSSNTTDRLVAQEPNRPAAVAPLAEANARARTAPQTGRL